MSALFESTEIKRMELANRFVRSATWEGMATAKGAVTSKLTRTLVDLAKGGVGLIITGHMYISPEGQASPQQLGIYSDDLIDGLKTMTDVVHEAGGKIVAQLAHAGHFAIESLTGQVPLVVSDFDGLSKTPRHELTDRDIKTLVTAFSDAALRAEKAGFDGVQIHSAHSYLLSQFLSPFYNRRNDDYGGRIPDRARIHLEIINAVREKTSLDYPVLIKINSEDFLENGLTQAGSLLVCKLLSEAGIDAIEISGGTQGKGKISPIRTGINSEEKEAYFKKFANEVKQETTTPIILVGGIRSFTVAEQIIKSNTADYISMCRPLIREPGLVNRWKSGDLSRAACKSDNLCFKPAMTGKGIYCVTEEREH